MSKLNKYLKDIGKLKIIPKKIFGGDPTSEASVWAEALDDYVDSLVYSYQPIVTWSIQVTIPNSFIHLNPVEYWYACPVSFDLLIFLFGDIRYE